MMATDELLTIAVRVALRMGLDPALVCAVCMRESGWQQYAVRYEPAFYERYISGMNGLTATEMTMRATSFGLMQIMGQTAREQGFRGILLAALLDPENAVTQGCIKLQRELTKYRGDVTLALNGYNGGGDPSYAAAVMAHYGDYAYLNSATRQA